MKGEAAGEGGAACLGLGSGLGLGLRFGLGLGLGLGNPNPNPNRGGRDRALRGWRVAPPLHAREGGERGEERVGGHLGDTGEI